MEPAVLITIPFSHFSEKARWALDRTGLPYEERGHLPMLHYAATRLAGGGSTVPVLQHRGRTLADSTDILQYLDSLADELPQHVRLYPIEAAARAECEALETRFDEELGPATTRLAYFFMLPRLHRYSALVADRVPLWERPLVSGPLGLLAAPLMAAALRRQLNVTKESAARARATLDAVLTDVAARLADDRPYLMGDRFTTADLTLAALLVPVLLPLGYRGPLPSAAEAPPGLRALSLVVGATPAGALARRLYAQDRWSAVP